MALPRTLRPVRTRTFAVVLTVVISAAALTGWVLLPAHIRAQFTVPQVLTLLGFLAIMIGIMLLVGFSSVRVDTNGLRVRNGPVLTTLAWADVVGFRFRQGDPWAYAVIRGHEDEPRKVAMLGVQATDGARATNAVEWLRDTLSAQQA